MIFIFNALVGAVLGAYVGSFLAAVIKFLPQIVLADPSEEREPKEVFHYFFRQANCPHCQQQPSAIGRLPIIGYFLQKRVCRGCRQPLEIRKAAIEAITAALFGAMLLFFPLSFSLIFVLFVFSVLICCFMTDYDYGILPDQLTLTLVWGGLIASLWPIFAPPGDAIIGAVGGYGIFWLFNLVYKYFRGFDGMYPGDFKLNAGLGACLGLHWLLIVLMLSFAAILFGAAVQFLFIRNAGGAAILYKEVPYGCYSTVISSAVFLLLLIGWI